MAVTIQLPVEIERRLRSNISDLDSEAKAAMLIELYRREKITRYELSLALDLSRFETDALLKKHNVCEDLPTSQEAEEDLRQARNLLAQ
jgi:hypothetical protein